MERRLGEQGYLISSLKQNNHFNKSHEYNFQKQTNHTEPSPIKTKQHHESSKSVSFNYKINVNSKQHIIILNNNIRILDLVFSTSD